MTIHEYSNLYIPQVHQPDPLERIASGLAINQAADNPASLQIAELLNTRANGFSQAVENVTSGIAFTQIGDRAISEQSDILDTIKERLIEASTATTNDDQRAIIKDEVQKLLTQFDDIAAQTNYNERNILQSSADDQAASDVFQVQAGDKAENLISLEGIQSNSLGVGLEGLFSETDVSFTADNARDYLEKVDDALTTLNDFRGELGSTQNQLQSSFSDLRQQVVNTEAAESVISNVNFAQEVSNFSKQNILAQVGALGHSQAHNISQQAILRLLT